MLFRSEKQATVLLDRDVIGQLTAAGERDSGLMGAAQQPSERFLGLDFEELVDPQRAARTEGVGSSFEKEIAMQGICALPQRDERLGCACCRCVGRRFGSRFAERNAE